jgi:O-antigen/teichoic acid export membrane protein
MKGINSGPLFRRLFQDVSTTLLSTLLVQAVTFGILAVSGLVLEVDAFARLMIIVTTIMVSSGLMDFGLNATATKFYSKARDKGVLALAFKARIALVPIGAAIGAAVWWYGLRDIGLGIAIGPFLNIWNGARVADQARQYFLSFARMSIAFALVRGVGGFAALLLDVDVALVALAVYALPVLVLGASASRKRKRMRSALSAQRLSLEGVARYAVHIYLNSITFMAVPYVPQYFIASQLNTTAVATYGLIVTFTAPLSLLIYSMRSVLLPHMLGDTPEIERLIWSRRGLLLISSAWVVLTVGGGLFAAGLDIVYGHRFPQLGHLFTIYFFGYSGAATIGFYSLSTHTRDVPHLASAIGVIKLIVLMPMLFLYGENLTLIVSIAAAIMIVFEALLALLIYREKRS